jgi:hypothetical protein
MPHRTQEEGKNSDLFALMHTTDTHLVSTRLQVRERALYIASSNSSDRMRVYDK